MDEYSFVSLLNNFFISQGYATKREVAAGYGRADLVLGKIDEQKKKIRDKNNQSTYLLNEKYFEVLRQLPDLDSDFDPLHIAELIDNITFSKNYLKNNIISFLEKNGYVVKVGDNLFYKVNGWLPIATEIIAIEAKLENWKKGILQANRYKSFADKVFLALPERTAHLVDLDMLKKLNMGLFIMNEAHSIREVVKAKRVNESYADKRNLVTEYLLSSCA